MADHAESMPRGDNEKARNLSDLSPRLHDGKNEAQRKTLGLKSEAEMQTRIAQERASKLVKGVLGIGFDGIPIYEASIPTYEASMPTYELYAENKDDPKVALETKKPKNKDKLDKGNS